MKIKSIKRVGTKPVYDISVDQAEHYVLENGVITHNTGILYSSDTVINITRAQDKQGSELIGYNFNMNIMKSRHSREKARVPLNVTFNNGINVFSGLLEMALASGDVIKPSNGWYQRIDCETGEIVGNKLRANDTNTHEFWDPILKGQHFKQWVEHTFGVGSNKLLADNVEDGQIDQSIEQFTSE